jgi:Undecaprenyl-phosphate glucose phosphotransferase
MSEAPNWSRIEPHQTTSVPAEIPTAPSETRQGLARKLIQPLFIERTVPVVDAVLIVAASFISSYGYHWLAMVETAKEAVFGGVGIIVAINFLAIMATRRNYILKNLMAFTRQATETIAVWAGVCAMLAIVAFTMKIGSEFSRGTVILFILTGLPALLIWRFAVMTLISHALANGSFARKKIIIVAERDQNASSRPLFELRRYGYHPVKTCEISREEIASAGITASLRAKLADVVQFAKAEKIDDVYMAVRWHNHRIIDAVLDALAVLPISVHLVPDDGAARFLNHPIANVGTTWTAALRRAPLTKAELAAKRFFDVSLATVALLTLLPLLLITAILIKLDSRGPVLFRQKRNGFNDGTFNIFKFRTMHTLDDGAVVMQARRNDPRVTRLGRALRRSSIDELPQLLNVIRGDMSLVGPRPHATSHNSEYEKLIANYAFRHHVKPGLTGWAQVNGFRGETYKIEQMERRVEYDLWYINNWSPWLDLKILLKTIVVALNQTTAY